jgi:hypothetical protein
MERVVDALMRHLHETLEQTQTYFPSETLLVCILGMGVLLLVVAFLWAMVALIRHGSRGLSTSLLVLIGFPIVAVIATVVILMNRVSIQGFSHEDLAEFLILAALAVISLLIVVVFVAAIGCFRITRGAVYLGVVAALLIAAPYIYTRAIEPMIFEHYRPPWVARVDGELHVTLTGIPNFDYDRLKDYENAEVLQMANPDVTDETLKKLANFKMLTELDLNDTQVDDAGLAILKNCASLKKLRLANTKITDAGFREYILPRDWIEEIDVTGTPVESKTLRLWKLERDGRKYVN